MDTEILISFLIASMILTVSPGPDNIYVLMQSITHGKKYGIATTIGLVSGILIHTSLVAFGVSAIIKESATLFFAIKLFGALYLFYLAYKVFTSKTSLDFDTSTTPKKSLTALFKQGFIMNVLNPKVSIFFLAFFPGFLFSNTWSSITQFYVLGVLFMLQAFIIFSTIAILAGSISNTLHKNARIASTLKWLQIIVFIGIGVFILLSKK